MGTTILVVHASHSQSCKWRENRHCYLPSKPIEDIDLDLQEM